MNTKSDASGFSSSLTPSQIETLQQQIRQFKALGKRFTDSHLPKTPESINQNPVQPQTQPKSQQPSNEVEVQAPALSWQCFNALLFYGPPKVTQEGAISFASSDIGCFSKGANLPLVVTRPFIATLREQTLAAACSSSYADSALSTSLDTEDVDDGSLIRQQRVARAQLVQQHLEETRSSALARGLAPSIHPPVAHAPGNYLSELLPFRSFYRTKKQARREVKAAEKEERRKKAEADDRKRRRANEYQRAILAHRENFLRFHKNKRSECSKTARLVKLWVENVDAKREKDEARAEVRRLQALKENDMEAYAALVADTRNGRLKFLLNETDTYIATINKMIQDQRVELPPATGAEAQEAAGDDQPSSPRAAAAQAVNAIESEMARDSGAKHGSANRVTQATKDYYRSTHRTVEVVAQPTMLRGGDLKEYQLSGLQWMVSLYNNNLNGILADEMGLGKTIQTIALLAYLMEYKHNNGPFLVVVPLSTLSNWVNEFNKWAPDMLKVVYKGPPEDRKRVFREEVEAGQLNVLLTTYEYIMKDKASLRKLTWQYIIVDEGHRMKNAQSKFAQTLGTVYQSRHRLLLTGTPLQNNLPELWALLNFLLPTIFSSVDTFDQWFNKPFTAFRVQGPQAAAEDGSAEVAVLSQEERMLIVHRLHEVLRPFMLRRVKDQVLDQLPDKVEKVLRCNLSGWQRKMYHSITMKGLAAKDKDGGGGGGLNNTIMQLRKVCNHPYLFMRDYAVDEDLVRASGKFELLDRMLPKLKAAGHRVLLFSQMVELMNFLEQFFLLRGFAYLRLDGNTSSEEREKRMYMFNDPDSPYFIFLLSTRAGGLGLNLATADTVIIFDSDWNPMMDAQAQDRAHRIGQKNEVRVFRLLTTSPVEERILSRATDKKNLTGLVVEAGKFTAKASGGASALVENKELMESMLQEWSAGGGAAFSSEAGAGDYESAAGEEDDLPDDEAINEMMASYAGEMELYTRMDAERLQRKTSHWVNLHQALSLADAPPLPSRLMGASEKPYWLTNDCWPTKYSVLMTDMMTLAPPPRKKKGRRKKDLAAAFPSTGDLLSQADASQQGGAEGDSEEEEDGDTASVSMTVDSEQPLLVAGFAMRKRKEVAYDDGMTDLQYTRFLEKQAADGDALQLLGSPAAGPGGKAAKKEKAAKPAAEAGGGSVYKELAKVVKDIQAVRRVDGPGYLAELFADKPPKAIYPDYYQLIAAPIALKDISARLKKGGAAGGYRYLEEVEQDLALMAHNARTFNLDTSPVFQDAEAVRREFFERCHALRARFGLPEATSSAVAPLPAIGCQLYGSSREYRCDLTHAVQLAAAVVEPEALPPPVKAPKRKLVLHHTAPEEEAAPLSAKKARQEAAPKAGSADFHDPYPPSNGSSLRANSSSLSLSLKRQPASSVSLASSSGNGGSGSQLVLSFKKPPSTPVVAAAAAPAPQQQQQQQQQELESGEEEEEEEEDFPDRDDC